MPTRGNETSVNKEKEKFKNQRANKDDTATIMSPITIEDTAKTPEKTNKN